MEVTTVRISRFENLGLDSVLSHQFPKCSAIFCRKLEQHEICFLLQLSTFVGGTFFQISPQLSASHL